MRILDDTSRGMGGAGDGRSKYLPTVSSWHRALELGIGHLTRSSKPSEGLPVYRTKELYSFLTYFKTLSIAPAPKIEPATSRSAVKRSTDWANPAAVTPADMCIWRNISPAIMNDHDPKRTNWDRQNLGLFFTSFMLALIYISQVLFFHYVQSHSQCFSVVN